MAASVPASADDWTGFSVGLFAGANFTDGEIRSEQPLQDRFEDFGFLNDVNNPLLTPIPDNDFPFRDSFSESGFIGGGLLGYSVRAGSFVFGVEGEFSGTDSEASDSHDQVTNATYFNPVGLTDTITAVRSESYSSSVKQTANANFRLKAGMLLTPSIMAYVSGGYAAGHIESRINYTATTVYSGEHADITHTSVAKASWDDWENGYTIGGGVEALMGGGWSLGLDYQFSDYGDFNRSVDVSRTTDSANLLNNTSEGDDPTSIKVNQDLQSHAVTARLRYRFGN